MTPRNDATLRQITAADPARSTWLSANAGSGKTRVLTDRVARLLLRGVSPQQVLCLTYTKAAAAEMQNRLFARLGNWAMLDDETLRAQLSELGEEVTSADHLARARTLFAAALETPGGLKIQTIHSFCASILRRFPLEAGVSPQFAEMEDRASARLREEVVDTIALGPDAGVVIDLARELSGEDIAELTNEVARSRDMFAANISDAEIYGWFGVDPEQTEERILRGVFVGGEQELIERVARALAKSGPKDASAGAKLAALTNNDVTVHLLNGLADVLLNGKASKNPFSAKLGSFPNIKGRELVGADLPELEDLMARVETGFADLRALNAARHTRALYRFAQVFIAEYDRRKMLSGLLDFDDLIARTRQLLTQNEVAQWVLYKLDGGIDHILVDEAQDTSPSQWQVIRQLTQEFTAGAGASDAERTVFVVGDLKQSIYSFQGADPEAFAQMRQHYDNFLGAQGRDLQVLTLDYSFRSSPPVLRAVDRTFAVTNGRGVDGPTHHLPFFPDLPGRVDLWPVVEDAEAKEKSDWFDPVDMISENHHTVRLAQQVARKIKTLCESGSIPGENGEMRRIEPGDFLILVRRRKSGVFPHIITACKSMGIPIAGADRLRLSGELAVKDIAAVLGFLATPEDDLSLAAALRSPLFGWTEQQLFDLAHRRKETHLWRALEHRSAEFPETHAILRDLRDQGDFLRPYDLIERLLIRHDGRRRLLARLGDEASDGIDTLLAQALAYERSEVPSLTGFVGWLESDDVEVKRQLDSAGNQVRVMTVHGAKGLESPIVILPDTGKPTTTVRQGIIPLDRGVGWKMKSEDNPPQIAAALDAIKDKQDEERRRLLYVALTRAEKWLIVAGSGDVGSADQSWYRIVEAGLQDAGAARHPFESGVGLRLEAGDWTGAPAQTGPGISEPQALPEWAGLPAPDVPPEPKVLTPSGLGGAKAIWAPGAGEEDDAAKKRGRQIHKLLEFLPAYPSAEWADIASALLAAGEDAATPEETQKLLQEAAAVLNAPHLAHVFLPNALAEIPLVAPLPELGGLRMRGVIDRLIIEPDRVLAIDFKTNATVPDKAENVPIGILRQMGAYASALQQIYPSRRIETAILWTSTASLMALPHDIVRQALGDTPTS